MAAENSSSVLRSGRGSRIWRGRVESWFKRAIASPVDQNLIAFSVVRAGDYLRIVFGSGVELTTATIAIIYPILGVSCA
jgi:hypothetical protein